MARTFTGYLTAVVHEGGLATLVFRGAKRPTAATKTKRVYVDAGAGLRRITDVLGNDAGQLDAASGLRRVRLHYQGMGFLREVEVLG